MEPIMAQSKFDELYKLGGGKNKLIITLLEKYEVSVNRAITEIRSALKNNESEKIFREIHAMKGSSGTLAMQKIFNELTILEEEVRQNNLINVENKMNELELFLYNVVEFKKSLNH